MRGLEKKRMKRDRHTRRHTYGHRDSMIESAQWADSMKIGEEKINKQMAWPWQTPNAPLYNVKYNVKKAPLT